MPGLEALDVSYNSLTDLWGLQFAPLKELVVLNAANNEISKIDYLEGLKKLRELNLSRNKIRAIEPTSFHPSHIICKLIFDYNGLRTL